MTEIDDSNQKVDTKILVETWNFLRQQCLVADSIENVKIQFIRLSKQLSDYVTKIGELAPVINESLDEFSVNETSNVVLTELRKKR